MGVSYLFPLDLIFGEQVMALMVAFDLGHLLARAEGWNTQMQVPQKSPLRPAKEPMTTAERGLGYL